MLRLLALLLSFHSVLAQFSVSFDKTSYGAGDSITVAWSSDGSQIDLSSQKVGKVLLCTCNTTGFNCMKAKDDIPIQQESSVQIPVSSIAGIGQNGPYLIQFASNDPGSTKYTLAYSHGWFTLSGMTGSQPAGKSCDAPYGGVYNFPNTASSSTISWPSYTIPTQYQGIPSASVPFQYQLGPTRYAPSQSTPGSKVTATVTPTRRHPTSSVSSTFTTYFINSLLPITTVTPSGSPFTQKANYVSTIATTPKGTNPSAIVASFDQAAVTVTKHGRRRRWADY